VESAARFRSIVGVCVRIPFGADGDDGHSDDGHCDGVSDGDHSIRSAKIGRLPMSTLA